MASFTAVFRPLSTWLLLMAAASEVDDCEAAEQVRACDARIKELRRQIAAHEAEVESCLAKNPLTALPGSASGSAAASAIAGEQLPLGLWFGVVSGGGHVANPQVSPAAATAAEGPFFNLAEEGQCRVRGGCALCVHRWHVHGRPGQRPTARSIDP